MSEVLDSEMGAWWAEFFDETFADLVLARPEPSVLEATLDFLVERLALRPGDSVLDQGCGIGRLSLPLALRGFQVIGVDLVEDYVRRATAEARQHGASCDFHAADAFDFLPPTPCDAAFNWYTSFGFSEDDALNARMLHRAFEALKPGGRFALDYANVPRVLRDFREHMVTHRPQATGEALILRESKLELARGLLVQRWTFVLPDGRRLSRDGQTRLYMPNELRHLLLQAGFEDVTLYGDVRGEPFTPDSPRCLLVARRPGGRS